MNLQAALPALVANSGGGGDVGLGVGGGLIGGLLLGSLLRGNGGLLGNGSEGGVTAADLSAQIASVKESQQAQSLLEQVGDLRAALPNVQSELQLGMANQSAAFNAQMNRTENVLQQGISNLSSQIAAGNFSIERTLLNNQLAEANQKLTVAQLEAFELRSRNDRACDQFKTDLTLAGIANQVGGLRSTINVGVPTTSPSTGGQVQN